MNTKFKIYQEKVQESQEILIKKTIKRIAEQQGYKIDDSQGEQVPIQHNIKYVSREGEKKRKYARKGYQSSRRDKPGQAIRLKQKQLLILIDQQLPGTPLWIISKALKIKYNTLCKLKGKINDQAFEKSQINKELKEITQKIESNQ